MKLLAFSRKRSKDRYVFRLIAYIKKRTNTTKKQFMIDIWNGLQTGVTKGLRNASPVFGNIVSRKAACLVTPKSDKSGSPLLCKNML